LVLGFGGVTPQQIRSGVGVLAEVLEQQVSRRGQSDASRKARSTALIRI
jgi:hypothetical protein